MFSLLRSIPRASRSPICSTYLRQLSTSRTRQKPPSQSQTPHLSPFSSPSLLLLSTHTNPHHPTPPHTSSQTRSYAGLSPADVVIDRITEQYATARDEFEIAAEETEKRSVYAEDDRRAAREELDRLKEMFAEALGGEEGEEVRRRVGSRIRELEEGVKALEVRALED